MSLYGTYDREEVVMRKMGDETGQDEGVQDQVIDALLEDITCRERESEAQILMQAELLSINRQQPRTDGIYLKGTLANVQLFFTIDTGAVRSVISKRVYDKIPACNRPLLEKIFATNFS
jgi:hypothetical protein